MLIYLKFLLLGFQDGLSNTLDSINAISYLLCSLPMVLLVIFQVQLLGTVFTSRMYSAYAGYVYCMHNLHMYT
jgi:hypothetical protein